MTETRAERSGGLQIEPGLFPELASTALVSLRFHIETLNEKFKVIVASRHDQEQYGHDVWRFNYEVRITWTLMPEGIEAKIAVSEPKYPFQQSECQRLCDEIWKEIESNAKLAHDTPDDQRSSYGSATWAMDKELEAAGYLPDHSKPDSACFIVGRVAGKQLIIPEALTHRHVLVCGPTGCGKSSGVFIPNLVERIETSAIVTESTPGNTRPNLYGKTAGWRALAGQKILYFNPNDLTSCRINPLDMVQTFDQAAHVAMLIVQNSTLPNNFADQIWQQSETHLLTSLIWHASGLRRGKRRAELGDNANLGHIRALLRLGPEGIAHAIASSGRRLAKLEFQAFVANTSPNFRYGVVSGLMQRLNLWVNPQVVALTEVTDFDLDELSEQLFTFYLATAIHRPEDKPLAALMLNFLLNVVLERGFKYPLTLLLDEFANFGYVPSFTEKLTVIRNNKIGVVLGIQDYVQLRKVYRDDDAKLLIGQPGTRIFFRPQENMSAQRISMDLGYKTLYTRKVNGRGQVDEREQPRLLLDSSEILRLPEENIIAFLPTANPVMATKFHWTDYDQATKFEPPPRSKIEIAPELDDLCEKSSQQPEWHDKAEKEIDEYVQSTKKSKTKSSGAPKSKSSAWAEQQSATSATAGWSPEQIKQPSSSDRPWDSWPDVRPVD